MNTDRLRFENKSEFIEIDFDFLNNKELKSENLETISHDELFDYIDNYKNTKMNNRLQDN